MKLKLLSVALCFGSLFANAQQAEYADPALRSAVVAVEFTGQRCRYCPNMSRSIEEHEKKYGKDRYIIAALHHLEEYSLLPSNHVSLYNEEAIQYAKSVIIPKGLPFLYYNCLGSEEKSIGLAKMYELPDLLECNATMSVTSDRQYSINVKTRLRRDQQEFAKNKKILILFWALENGIVAFQDDNGKYIYPEHNHIFRGSVNGTWGEAYNIGDEYSKKWPIPSSVSKVENSEVIVFFLDAANKNILDAGRVKLSENSGIEDVEIDKDDENAPIYNLMGIQVKETTPGHIYIQNRKKFIAK